MADTKLEEKVLTHVQSITDEFGHREKKYSNDCGFDRATLERRDKELIELQKAYPNTCMSWLELAWNYTEFTPKEEQDEIIRSRRWETMPQKKRDEGGVYKSSMTIEKNPELKETIVP